MDVGTTRNHLGIMTQSIPPQVFISYSWSSPDHEAWVLRLAEDLTSQGLFVALDKWDLQPGHDATAFMESMVTDHEVTKVLLICDRQYVEKSDRRSGGAGTEAQIITARLYATMSQEKFVAVIAEKDEEGKPVIPVYYGSRIYIDLTDPATYSAQFDRLLRWIWDQPLYIRPEPGEKPAFLGQPDVKSKIATSVEFRRAFDAVRNSAPNAVALVTDYFAKLAKGIETFRFEINQQDRGELDELAVKMIDSFLPYRNEAIELFSVIAQNGPSEALLHTLHRFLEALLPYTDRHEQLHSSHNVDFDHFRFMVHELFLYAQAVLIRSERFAAAAYLLSTEYYWEKPFDREQNMHTFVAFFAHLRLLEHRNNRLNLNRASIHADMLIERNQGTGIDPKYLMAADLILFIRSRQIDQLWWPETLLYAARHGGAFEIFARAKSIAYFNRVKGLLNVENKTDLERLVAALNADQHNLPRWNYNTLSLTSLLGLAKLATIP
jgi:hypothetical protein